MENFGFTGFRQPGLPVRLKSHPKVSLLAVTPCHLVDAQLKANWLYLNLLRTATPCLTKKVLQILTICEDVCFLTFWI